jgi:transposase
MLCLVSPESRVPNDHPLREIKRLADTALKKLSRVFNAMYAEAGRPSVPPERLLKSQLLIALYSIRSERQFCEQLEYNLLFRWFVDMDMLEEAFDASTFSRNRDRLMEHEVAALFFAAIRDQGSELMSHDHFSAAVARGLGVDEELPPEGR